MATLQLHDCVVLRHDLAGHRLLAGDVGAIVHVYGDGKTFEVEFVASNGHWAALIALERAELEPLPADAVMSTRPVRSDATSLSDDVEELWISTLAGPTP